MSPLLSKEKGTIRSSNESTPDELVVRGIEGRTAPCKLARIGLSERLSTNPDDLNSAQRGALAVPACGCQVRP
jgi:hypothetical protein